MLKRRSKLLLKFDDALRSHHKVGVLIGVDEVGRGPLAGPVVAAAVALDGGAGCEELIGVRDSKTLSEKQREHYFPLIKLHAQAVGVAWASHEEIDKHNIFRASLLAMRRAVERLLKQAAAREGLVIVDGNHAIPDLTLRQQALVKGDAHSLAVASASVIAKVVRDRWMTRLDRLYPGYGFSVHRGYGTPGHWDALNRLGPSPIHRRSFESVSQIKLSL